MSIDVRFDAVLFIRGQSVDLIITEPRRAFDRAGPESEIRAGFKISMRRGYHLGNTMR